MARFELVRVVLALLARLDLIIYQMDVTTAFLNGKLQELVYMKQPKEFVEDGKEMMVCRLKCSIYGLLLELGTG